MDNKINYLNQTILVGNTWYSLKELGEEIKFQINSGNYKIKHLSDALETLQECIENAKEIKIVVSKEIYERSIKQAKLEDISLEKIVQKAILQYLDSAEELENDIGSIPSAEDMEEELTSIPTIKTMEEIEVDLEVDVEIDEEIENETKNDETIKVEKEEKVETVKREPIILDKSAVKPIIKPKPEIKPKPQIQPKPKIEVSEEAVILEETITPKKTQPSIIVDKKRGLTEDDWFKSDPVDDTDQIKT